MCDEQACAGDGRRWWRDVRNAALCRASYDGRAVCCLTRALSALGDCVRICHVAWQTPPAALGRAGAPSQRVGLTSTRKPSAKQRALYGTPEQLGTSHRVLRPSPAAYFSTQSTALAYSTLRCFVWFARLRSSPATQTAAPLTSIRTAQWRTRRRTAISPQTPTPRAREKASKGGGGSHTAWIANGTAYPHGDAIRHGDDAPRPQRRQRRRKGHACPAAAPRA